MKGFATSLSIVISSCVSWFIPAFNFHPSLSFFFGSALVMAATVMYSSGDAKRPQPKQAPAVEPKQDV